MTILFAGLLIFLGTHSIGIFANDWRASQRQRIGAMAWKGGYALASLVGFALIVWGFSIARLEPVVLWTPPVAMRHIAALLTLIAFILLAATYIPHNGIKAKVHHPMTLGVTVWAFAHLLANGQLVDVILFGSFLLWSKVLFITSRKRDRAAGTHYPDATFRGTVTTVSAGIAAWVLFAFWLHGWLIGVRPFAVSN